MPNQGCVVSLESLRIAFFSAHAQTFHTYRGLSAKMYTTIEILLYILTLYSNLILTYHMAGTERPGLPAFSLMARISSSLGLTIGPLGNVDTRFSHWGFKGGAGGVDAVTGGRIGGGGGGGAPVSSSPCPERRNLNLVAASWERNTLLSSSCACSLEGTAV